MTNNSDEQDNKEQGHFWRIKPDINYGNVLTLVSMIVAIVVGYTKLETRVESLSLEIRANSARDEVLLTQFSTLRDLSFARQELISNKLTRIETVLERVEKAQQAPR